MKFNPFKSVIILALCGSTVWFGCKKEDTKTDPTIPVLEATKAVTDITQTSANSGGNITSDGGATITARGVCYGKSESPSIDANSFTTNGTGKGEFGSAMTGLDPSTKYFVRAYATNAKGTGYGAEVSFTTEGVPANLPVINSNSSVSNITTTTATFGGSVSSDGGSPVTARGVCWNTAGNPTVALSTKTTNGSGTGSFTSNITGLSTNTTYKIRAYATNANGTSYGNEVAFTTNNVTVSLPVISSTTAINTITQYFAYSGGNITSDGNGTITARGVCWNTNPNPSIANSKTSDGTGMGSFISEISGLSEGTMYYVRAYATNIAGTAYGNELNFTTNPATVQDVDGNVYQTVKIGTQTWMNTNLKTRRYRDGGNITTGLSNSDWVNISSGAFAVYENNLANNDNYGKLYNFYAVVDSRGLCPTGWHVPSDAEWITLENFLGGSDVAGTKMKTTTGWQFQHTGTNESGFSGLPGGQRSSLGDYSGIGTSGTWWSSTEFGASAAKSRALYNNFNYLGLGDPSKLYGLSVRCIKD